MSTTGVPSPPPPGPPHSAPPHAAPPHAGGQPPKRLVRLTDQGMFAGVAAGIGWYAGIDPTLIRIGLVVLTLTTGVGVPIYLGAWLLMPSSTADQTPMTAPNTTRYGRLLLIDRGVAIVAVTGLLGQIDVFSGRTVLAAILIGLGILLFSDDKSVTAPPGFPGDGPHSWAPAPPPGAQGQTAPAPFAGHPVPPSAPHPPRPPQQQSAFEPYAAAWTGPNPRNAPPPPKPCKHPKSHLGRLTFGLWVLAISAWAILARFSPLTMDARSVLGVTVATVGIGLLIGTLFGRSRGLIAVGVVASLVLAGFTTVDRANITSSGGVGEHRSVVTDIEQLGGDFDWLIGENRIDLDDLDLDGQDVMLSTSIFIGEVTISVPDDVTVLVDGTLRAGEMSILGETREGTGLSIDVEDRVPDSDGTLTIRVDATVGEINVNRQSRGSR